MTPQHSNEERPGVDIDKGTSKGVQPPQSTVTNEPILAHPELDKQFELEVDTSGFAVEAVPLQRKEDNMRHPVGYHSATLNVAK